MGIIEADTVQDLIEKAANWPIWSVDAMGQSGMTPTGTHAQIGQYGSSTRDLALWVALRESDRARITSMIGWDKDRKYRVDPLPERIAGAYADLLYSDPPEFTAATDSDQKNLDEMLKANGLASELHRWAMECVSEGEVWWRVYVDRDESEWPIIATNSRLDVIPYFVGRKIAGAAFVSDLFSQQVMLENEQQVQVWRHIEIQTEGYVRNLLYRGSITGLGTEEPLTAREETAELLPEWDHGLGVMLAGRIPNKLGRDWRLGVSEYQGVKDLILDLNEAHTIMAENARNTAKARMVVPSDALDEEGKFDPTQDVIVKESMDEELGNTKAGPYVVLEYTFQAGPLLQYMDNLINTILTRVGLAEQFVGGGRQQSEAQAYTGTALRTRLIPTTLAASGKAKYQDDEVPQAITAAQLVSSLPAEKNGTGQSWATPDKPPKMKRSSVLPEDQNEETQRHVTAVQGEVESIETAVREQHRDWTEEDIKAEIKRIREDRASRAPKPGLQTAADDVASHLAGDRQPGVGGPGGQSPGKTPPTVVAGGPK